MQVGKSTEARDDLLARFRAALGLVTLSIVVVALAGGWLATRSALAPIRALIAAVAAHHPTPAAPTRACRSRAPATRSTS